MKSTVFSLVIGLAFASSVVRAGDANQATDWVGKKTTTDGLALSVWIAHGVPWEQMTTEWTITNTSDKEIVRYSSGILQGFRFHMTTDGSGEVPITENGNRLLLYDTGASTKYVNETLKPGESFTISFKLSELFSVAEPGKFKLTVQWEKNRLSMRGKNLKLEVKDTTFTVGTIAAGDKATSDSGGAAEGFVLAKFIPPAHGKFERDAERHVIREYEVVCWISNAAVDNSDGQREKVKVKIETGETGGFEIEADHFPLPGNELAIIAVTVKPDKTIWGTDEVCPVGDPAKTDTQAICKNERVGYGEAQKLKGLPSNSARFKALLEMQSRPDFKPSLALMLQTRQFVGTTGLPRNEYRDLYQFVTQAVKSPTCPQYVKAYIDYQLRMSEP